MELLLAIGVDYSPAKTHISKDMFEFAKRIFYKGKEISPFPISALHECGKAFDMLTVLISEQNKRNWICLVDVWSSVSSYQGVVLDRSSSYRKRILEKSWACKGVLDLVQGTAPANKFLNELITRRGYSLPLLSEEVCKNILSNTIIGSFAESNILKSHFTTAMEYPLTS
jgi:hypothetical protein